MKNLEISAASAADHSSHSQFLDALAAVKARSKVYAFAVQGIQDFVIQTTHKDTALEIASIGPSLQAALCALIERAFTAQGASQLMVTFHFDGDAHRERRPAMLVTRIVENNQVIMSLAPTHR